MTSIIVQKSVPRFHSIRSQLSGLKWQSGVSTFFTENVPFSYSTSTWFASKIIELAHTLEGDWLELGSGLGILSRHILDLLKKDYPQSYQKTTLHLSDYAPALVNKMAESGLFLEHPNAKFHVIDAHDPQLGAIKPSVILISYLLDSLNCRHIEIENGEIFELLVESSIPDTVRLFDTTTYPPILLDAQAIYELIVSSNDEKKKRLAPFICEVLVENFTKIPLAQTDMSKEEKEDLIAFAKTIPEPHVRFNYAFGFSQILTQLFKKSSPECMILIQDFGYGDFFALPNPPVLATPYRSIICHAVYFPYIAYIAQKHEVHFNITPYTPGDTQLAVLYRGPELKKINSICDHVFETKGYAETQKIFNTVFEFKGSKEENMVQILALWDTLSDFEKEDYLVVLAFASSSFEEGYYEQAINFVEKLPPAYEAISIPAYYLLGKCYDKLNQIETAISYYQKCVTISAEYPSAYNELSLLYLKTKRYADYLESSKKFLAYSGESLIWEHFITQALVYIELGQKKKAAELIEWIHSIGSTALVPEKIRVKADSILRLI